MIVFAVEPFSNVIGEICVLNEHHWHHLQIFGLPLDPNYELYQQTADRGYCVIYTARELGEMVGYAVYFVSMNHHHRTTGWATSDVIWLEERARKPRVADRMREFIENDLSNRGVEIVETGARPEHPALARLLQARGYVKISETYAKRLRPCRKPS